MRGIIRAARQGCLTAIGVLKETGVAVTLRTIQRVLIEADSLEFGRLNFEKTESVSH